MEFLDVIRKRKSIRKYKSQKMEYSTLLDLVDCARIAPSGCNRQGWRFKIINKKEDIKLLKENNIFT